MIKILFMIDSLKTGGKERQLVELLKGLKEKIPHLNIVNTESKNNSMLINLEYPKDQDPREALFQYAVDSKWIITEMSPHAANLESVFRNLTMEETVNA